MKSIAEVLLNYGLGRADVSNIEVGLINKTYRVRASRGDFILQKLHPIYKESTIINVARVGEFLNAQGLIAPLVLCTTKGEWGVEDAGQWWRLTTFIPGRVLERAANPVLVGEAGKILGRFHDVMRNFHGVILEGRKPHESEKHWTQFLKALPPEAELGEEILGLAAVIGNMKNLFLSANLETTITHGDPKISNIIFEENTDCAVALIDLDGCNPYNNILVELGDAFRSWCGSYEDASKNCFDLNKFQAGWRGYLDGVKMAITKTERALLPQAIKLIILELASRFLRDYFEDSYFGWDAKQYPSRKAHNLARVKGQAGLYLDFLEKESEIDRIVKEG